MTRWWGIRHLRWMYYSYRVHSHSRMWAKAGVGWGFPNESDLVWLDRIRRGDA